MKKLILCIAFICAAQLSIAQDQYKNDVLEMIKVSGATGQVTAVIEQLLPMIPQNKHAEFKKEFDATLPALYDAMIPIYKKYYSHEDIKKMLEFYNSPVGKKISSNAENITKESMQVGQEWGIGLQGLMMKYAQ